ITAYGDETHVARGYRLGAVDYILTPVVPEVLRAKVSVFVELFRKTEEIRRQAARLRERAAQLHELTRAALAINAAGSAEKILPIVADRARALFGPRRAVAEARIGPGRECRATSPCGGPEPRAAARAAPLTASDGTPGGAVRVVAEGSVAPAAEVKSIALAAALDGVPVRVLGDSDRLQQVMWNLLSNAIKFTPKGGRVDVRVRVANGDAEISVGDTGAGISPEFLPHVF